MMFTRYSVAADLAAGRRVLELACGGGNGLGLVGARARSLVGGDYSGPLIRMARGHYGDRVPLARLSAERLPFRDGSFEVVLFFEASYYVPDMEAAFDEVARVLAPGGTAMFVNANPERADFIHSPHSVHYHTADEFCAALTRRGFTVRVEGAFPVDPPATGAVPNLKGTVFGMARQLLEGLHLVPRTLRGRARLKRLIFGRLRELPPELLPGYAPVEPRVPQAGGPVRSCKVLYITGTRTAA
jgi:SAM-dependent methyltransferase